MTGWVKIHRKIFSNGIWKKPTDFRLFFFLLVNAVFDVVRYDDIVVGRGQYLRSYRQLREDLSYIQNNRIIRPSLSVIKRAIEHLVNLQMIDLTDTRLGTLFTILNYEKYQTEGNFLEVDKLELGTGLGTDLEHPENNNKNDKNILITLSQMLIKEVNKKSSLYALMNKYKSALGEDKLFQILSGCYSRKIIFDSEKKLALYLEKCCQNNGHAKITNNLPEINEGIEQWMK